MADTVGSQNRTSKVCTIRLLTPLTMGRISLGKQMFIRNLCYYEGRDYCPSRILKVRIPIDYAKEPLTEI